MQAPKRSNEEIMKVREIMSHNVATIRPEAVLQAAAETMRACDIGALPVCDGPGIIGFITDRDITINAVAQGMDPKTTPVRDAMTYGAVFCYDDQDVAEAARVMQEQQIRRLPVMSHDEQLVGIVALADVARGNTDDNTTARTLEQISR